jgi:hypothetical protein
MTQKSASAGALSHFKRLSWKSRLGESTAIIVFFICAFLFGVMAGTLVPLAGKLSFSFGPANLLLFFLGGVALTLAVVFAVRFVDRKLFGQLKTDILAIEDRLISGDARWQMQDLEKLVYGYLKLKRLEAADYYSKKLLELSKSGGTEIMKLTDWMVTTECWVSTDAYHKGWNYKLVWLFETRGVLTMSPAGLDFQSKKLSFKCAPANIASVEIKRHPLWLKPFPFRYISLTISESGVRHVFNLTPSFAQTDTVFDCNRLVDVWHKRLQKLRQGMSQSGNFPDWLRDD